MKKILISTAALLAGGAALAQTAPPAAVAPPAPMARPMQDKVMTRAEVVAMVRDHFGKIDADRNGAITTAEMEQMRTKVDGDMKVRRFGHRLDGPRPRPQRRFRPPRRQQDGSISRDEFARAREERIERRVELREKAEDGAPKDGKDVRRIVTRHARRWRLRRADDRHGRHQPRRPGHAGRSRRPWRSSISTRWTPTRTGKSLATSAAPGGQ